VAELLLKNIVFFKGFTSLTTHPYFVHPQTELIDKKKLVRWFVLSAVYIETRGNKGCSLRFVQTFEKHDVFRERVMDDDSVFAQTLKSSLYFWHPKLHARRSTSTI
jgi:hypothetical protein